MLTSPLDSIQPKPLFALISGAIQLHYFQDPAITIQVLKDHIFPSEDEITLVTIESWVNFIIKVLTTLLSLKSLPQPSDIQETLQGYNITEQQQVMTWNKVLKDKIPQIHNKIVEKNRFVSSSTLQWRVDSSSDTTKTAFVKFNKKQSDGSEKEIVLELNQEQINALAAECKIIQAKLETLG